MGNRIENVVRESQKKFEQGKGITGTAKRILENGRFGSIHTQTIVTIDKIQYAVDTNYVLAVLEKYKDVESRKKNILAYKFIHVVDNSINLDKPINENKTK